MRLVDENNEVVDIGKDGEIQVKTYSVLKEYKRQKEKTRDLYTEDGFLRTGSVLLYLSTVLARQLCAVKFYELSSSLV